MGICLDIEDARGKWILEELGFVEMIKEKEQIRGRGSRIEYRDTFKHDKLPLFAEQMSGSYIHSNRWVWREIEYEYIHVRRSLQEDPILVFDHSDKYISIEENVEDILPFSEVIKKCLPKNGKILIDIEHSDEDVFRFLEFLTKVLKIEILKTKIIYLGSGFTGETIEATYKRYWEQEWEKV